MKKRLSIMKMKQIAAWKSVHPELSHEQLAEIFECTPAQARYALQKYAELGEMAMATKKGKKVLSSLIKDYVDEDEILDKQIKEILSQLEVETNIAVSTRLQHIKDVLIIKEKAQKLKLEKHLRGIDSDIVAEIIKKFMPDATNEDIIKIFNEAKEKVRSNG